LDFPAESATHFPSIVGVCVCIQSGADGDHGDGDGDDDDSDGDGVSNGDSSAKNISVRAELLRQSGRAPSEPSEKPRWRITPRPASMPSIVLHIAL
jgi:hypothetical protein